MNMQIFSLAGTLFSPSLKLEPLCPCHCSAEGAGLKGTFCQGRCFCLLVARAAGSATLISEHSPGAWPLLRVEVAALGWWFQLVVPPQAAPDIQGLSDWHSTAKGEIDMSCGEMSIKGAQSVEKKHLLLVKLQ